ncbi:MULTISPECIES: hypothetical protein [Enterobacter cloacae complex]|uniref:hypothetical protein n=1 Tax=Enterobacter cloacae complex TaxID=354276 RepID=UPI002075DD2F|nr:MULTISPECIES: hypothetical protein [Enterobacter cloacae complex]MCM7883737.1 hypothetical protein [Enterobacter sichuanensis]MCT2766573.1 hypothetical protein [Enterobacter cloacae]MDS0065286.1 hypothetical protein [Enterobacter cloacae subsp. cloacae]MDS0107959.1 hypothetical protein [Enterobacter cloacae subsp. cloacae]HBN6068723.1 hypothetical protein [Enterobacter cloacae]
MKLLLSPQRADYIVKYSAVGDVLTATMDEQNFSFDFSGMQNEVLTEFETPFPVCPLLYVKKTDDNLVVSALHFYGPDAEESEKIASVINL